MDKLQIMVADDSKDFRESIAIMLEPETDIKLVAAADSIDAALRLAVATQPDIILMDIGFDKDPQRRNGIDAARMILSASPHISILMLTILDDDAAIFESIRVGARGYIIKGATRPEILRYIRTVANGEFILNAAIARRVQSFFKSIPETSTPEAFPQLSARELEILTLMAQGLTKNNQIAERLSLSNKTVRNHVSNILSKLQVADRAQAILRARDAGLR